MDQLFSLLGYLPSTDFLADAAVKALAVSGAASAALKFGTPVLKKLATLTRTDKDDKALAIAEKVGYFLNLIALNPAVKQLASKSKSKKSRSRK